MLLLALLLLAVVTARPSGGSRPPPFNPSSAANDRVGCVYLPPLFCLTSFRAIARDSEASTALSAAQGKRVQRFLPLPLTFFFQGATLAPSTGEFTPRRIFLVLVRLPLRLIVCVDSVFGVGSKKWGVLFQVPTPPRVPPRSDLDGSRMANDRNYCEQKGGT